MIGIWVLILAVLGPTVSSKTNKEVYESALKDPSLMLTLYKDFMPSDMTQLRSDRLETVLRFNLFQNSVKEVLEINKKQEHYTVDMNFMSYLTDEERRQYTGFNVSDFLERVDSDRAPATKTTSSTTEKNWVESGHVTFVSDQGMCGSCWTFAGTGPVESRYAIQTGTLKKFSEQEALECVYDKSEKNGCRGGQYFHQWDWIKSKQIQTSSKDYPYKGAIYGCRSGWFKNQLTHAKLTGYVRTPTNYKGMEEALNTGPLAVGLRISKELYLYKSGVFVKEDCGTPANHAVVAVGYTSDYFLLKNSWGAKWGESGFVKFSREVDNMCDIALWAAYPLIEKTDEEIDISECSDKRGDCEEMAEHCGNGENWKIMATGCAATCGLCGCRDAMVECGTWTTEEYCTKPNYEEYMRLYCPLSCRKCDIHPTLDTHTCSDSSDKCDYYKRSGYCERYPRFVSTRCRKTCELCDEETCEDSGLVFCRGECRHAHMC